MTVAGLAPSAHAMPTAESVAVIEPTNNETTIGTSIVRNRIAWLTNGAASATVAVEQEMDELRAVEERLERRARHLEHGDEQDDRHQHRIGEWVDDGLSRAEIWSAIT